MAFAIPEHVRAYVRDVFAQANNRVATKICRMPTTHEESLDMALIEELSHHAAPVQLEGNWIVRIDTHFLGGGHHFRNWEVADIGIIVMFRSHGKLVRTKLALLQSKRLYPKEQSFDEGKLEDYEIGFARLWNRQSVLPAVDSRPFSITEESTYRSLGINDEQQVTINSYQAGDSPPVFYLFYNPLVLPWQVVLPISQAPTIPTECRVGSRVVPFSVLKQAMTGMASKHHPTFAEVRNRLPAPFDAPEHAGGWRLEYFMVDRLLDCRDGHVVAGPRDRAADRVFNRRGGPIAAALSISIDGPLIDADLES
jgi:hypothetical protein